MTVTEVRMSPDLRHATVFVEPLGGGHAPEVVKALNRHAKFLRGRLGRTIDMKFTPDLKFLHDESFDEAARMSRLFEDPARSARGPHAGAPSTAGRTRTRWAAAARATPSRAGSASTSPTT